MASLFLPKFKYYLTYEDVTTELVFAPEGWQEETVATFRRDLSYWGLMRSLSLPLRFVKDGRDILREAFGKYGQEAGVILEVKQRANLWNYETIFKGDLDFSNIDYDTFHFTLPLMESGISRLIKAKENTKYEFNLTGSDIVNIVLPGVNFNEEGQFLTKYVDTTDLNIRKRFVIGIDFAVNSLNSGFITARNTLQRNVADTDDFSGDAFVVGNRPTGVTLKIKGNFKGFVRGGLFNTDLCQLIFLNTITKEYINVPVSIVSTNTPQVFDVTFDFNYTLAQGHGICLYSRNSNGSTTPVYLTVNEGEIKVSYSSVSDPSNCKGIKGFDLYKRILNRIDPLSVPNSSLMLSDKWKNLIFTSGTAIRELENPKIKISFKEFFETWNALEDAGFGTIDGQTRIENKTFFARNTQAVNVGNVRTFKLEIAEELIFNSVKIGYNDGNTDDKDGLQEYNSGQVWSLPLTRLQKEQSFISPTRADQYGIEKLRVQFNITKQSTSDNESDNDTFMIDCYQDGLNYRPILGASYDSVTGLTNTLTAYNLRLTPKQNLLRHAGYLRSILDKLDGRYIEFASATKNADLKTVIDGFAVFERESIPVATLHGKYFKPYIATITCKNPKDVFAIMTATPYGYITFNYNDVTMSGFIMEVGVDLAKNTEREFKLLLTADSLIC